MNKKIRATVQIFFSELFSLKFSLAFLSWLGRALYGERLSTITLFYPANRQYIESVTFNWYAKRVKWRPTFGGFFVTSKGCGLIFAMGALEEEFSNPANQHHLLKVHEAMEEISQRLRIKSVAYSGILPSVLARAGVNREPIELVRTSHWIIDAIESVRATCALPQASPVVILGAAGYLGRRVVGLMTQLQPSQMIVEIDPEHQDIRCRGEDLLAQFRGMPILIVNISRRDVMERYIDSLWSGVVILNEVYPECSPDALALLRQKRVRYFHIQGVRAWSIPDFPGAYRGAVPCCAASAANAYEDIKIFKPQLKLLEK